MENLRTANYRLNLNPVSYLQNAGQTIYRWANHIRHIIGHYINMPGIPDVWELFQLYAFGDYSAQRTGRIPSANLLGETFLFLEFFLSESDKLTINRDRPYCLAE